jgi:DNA topoisomerase-1
MAQAILDQVAVDIATPKHDVVLRVTGSVIAFDGFMKLYLEGRDDPSDDEEAQGRLPDVKEGEPLERRDVRPEQHFTEPPPRFTEASLVKRLEELGIGRPSTYASIISVLQDRDYVVLDRKRFVPQDRGRLVTAFLESFFPQYVEYGFTADLESELDRISNGELEWKDVLREFWNAFHLAVESATELQRADVLARIEGILEAHIFPTRGDGEDSRRCAACQGGKLGLKLGKFGAFIGCSNYPECKFTRPLIASGNGDDDVGDSGPKVLGEDPDTGLEVSLRKGPYGHYVQRGEATEDGEKPKRTGLPRGMSPADVDLERALRLLALPREIGSHPDDAKPIVAGIGRYGPFLKHGDKYVSLPKDDDILTIGLNRAVTVIAEGKSRGGGRTAAEPLRELGEHPDDGKPVVIKKGRYGPYIQHNRIFASVPKNTEVDAVTMDQAVTLLAEKAAKKGKGKSTAKKSTAKKSTAKKSTAKKAKPKAKKAAKKTSGGGKAEGRAQAET